MANTSPNSYKDPYWTNLAMATEQELKLPDDLLQKIIIKGEKSNNDQISEAGAKTVFQIIPSTRKLALDKYGIDAYLSDKNAAKVAGLLLKDSLDRNGGDKAIAVAEYIGGTNRKNWGPITKSYVKRVLENDVKPEATNNGYKSIFEDESVNKQQTSNIKNIYDAYKSGKMNEQQLADFEEDVRDGKIMLPRGASLKTLAPQESNKINVPQKVFDAYLSGEMPREGMIQLEEDVKNGLINAPASFVSKNTEPLGLLGGIKEAITGSERSTQESEELPDWASMPELNELSIASAKAGLGTLFSNPAETVQIIQSNFPGTQIRQDNKGNYILLSSIDGNEYAIKPGFQVSDIPRAIGAVASFAPAARAATLPGQIAGAAATQGAIESAKSSVGGNFNPGDIALAGATAGIVPPVLQGVAKVAGMVANPVKAASNKIFSTNFATKKPPISPSVVAEETVQAGQVAQDNIPPIQPSSLSTEELAKELRNTLGKGNQGKQAVNTLAKEIQPNPEIIEAAKRLGIEDYLQPEHISTNQSYRELTQAIKSIPGSKLHAAEQEGIEKIAKRADDLIDELGGNKDLSVLSNSVKENLQATQEELLNKSNQIYKNLEKEIDVYKKYSTPKIIDFIEEKIKKLGDVKNITPLEKNVYARLKKSPSYALIDDTRKEIGRATQGAGLFKDEKTGMAKKLYELINEDQQSILNKLGFAEDVSLAKQTVKLRKGIENDLISLFGKNLDKSLVQNLETSVKKLPSGDTAKFINFIKAIPNNMREEVTASGLMTALGKSAKNNGVSFTNYAKWFENLERNKASYNAVMANLPKEAPSKLKDLYTIAKSISAANNQRISTGRIREVRELFKEPENLLAKIYENVKYNQLSMMAGSVAGAAASTVMGPLGAGVGTAVASALSKGAKPQAIKAADELISSTEFKEAIKDIAKGEKEKAAKRLSLSKSFNKFWRFSSKDNTLTAKQRWILQAVEGSVSTRDKE